MYNVHGDPWVPDPRIPVWDVGEVRLAVRVRHSRRGSDVAHPAHGELVGTSGQAAVASSSPAGAAAAATTSTSTTATTYVSVLQNARRWSRSRGNFLLGLAAEDEKSGEEKAGESVRPARAP